MAAQFDEVIYGAVLFDKFRSSNIAWFQYFYDEERLSVGFNSEAEYDYFEVPPDMVEDWCNAASKGRFHYKYIRDSFHYRRTR